MAKAPDQTPDDDRKRPPSTAKSVAVWIMLSFLILGLGGFGITSFSTGVTAIGAVGDTEITADDYARALQSQKDEIGAQLGRPLTTQEALSFGLDRQVRQSLITRAALDNEAARIGLSVGDQRVAAELVALPAFQGVSGSFDREAYRFALERIDQTEAQFEAGLRRDIAREVLQGIVAGGFTAPAALTDTLFAWAAERRGFSVLRLSEADLAAPIPDPTEAELAAHYEANIAAFTRPEAKRITYAALLPEAIAADQPVDETVLRQIYEDRIDEFVIPERRLVERLVFPDQAAADAARAALDAGTPFETLVTDRGLTLEAIDLGDVTRADLGEAGEAVFAAAEGSVAGPALSDLGPALFRVNAVLGAEETTFEEARDTLAIELQTDAARRLIADQVEVIDDLLAGGAELENLVDEAGMTLGTIDFVPGTQGAEAIEGYPAFRAAAEAVAEGDFPEAIVLEDGGLVALRLDEIVPAAPIPLAEARGDVAAAWRAEQLAEALAVRAAEIAAEIAGGAAIGSFGIVSVTPEITRDGFVDNVPASLVPRIFAMPEGAVEVIAEGEFVGVAQLDRILPADAGDADAEAFRLALIAQAETAIANDAFAAFAAALSAEAGITIDEAAINAVHAGLP
jgi:peptidyl-prolyl cis-trans isomerase D